MIDSKINWFISLKDYNRHNLLYLN